MTIRADETRGSVRISDRVVLRSYHAVLALCLLPSLSAAQTAGSSPTDRETISQLIEQIKELQQHDRDLLERIKALEANQKVAPTADNMPPPPATLPAPDPSPVPSPSPEMHTLRGIQ